MAFQLSFSSRISPGLSRLVALGAALALAACAPGGNAASAERASETQEATIHPESGLDIVPLTISSGDESHAFRVEVAATQAEQARGLMFRQELGGDEGMIFPFGQDRMASFWMKNTVIPLDIVFVRRDGTIESIAANTTPYSLEPVASGEPVGAVLELRGGRTAELAIEAGDRVKWGVSG